jgi:hypothetical protein
MDVFSDVAKKILRRKIEVIKVVMICKVMPPVATVLMGHIFVLFLNRTVCFYHLHGITGVF